MNVETRQESPAAEQGQVFVLHPPLQTQPLKKWGHFLLHAQNFSQNCEFKKQGQLLSHPPTQLQGTYSSHRACLCCALLATICIACRHSMRLTVG